MLVVLFRIVLISLFSLAFFAGSDVDVSKSALMISCLSLALIWMLIDSFMPNSIVNRVAKKPVKSIGFILKAYVLHPCWLWLIWALYIVWRIWQTPNQYYQLTHGYLLLIGALGFVIGFVMFHYRKARPYWLNSWLWALGVIVLIQLVFAWLQLGYNNNLVAHERLPLRENYYVKGSYSFEGGFGLFASLLVNFFGAYLWVKFKRLKLIAKIGLAIGFLSMLGLTMYSNSLTGILVACSFFVFAPISYYLSFVNVFKRSAKWKEGLLLGVSILLVFVVMGGIGNKQEPVNKRLDIKLIEAYSARLGYGDLGVALIAEKPWLGHGARMYNHLYLSVYDGDSSIWHNQDVERVHQEVIQLVCDYGLIGLFLFVLAGFATLLYFIQLSKYKIKADSPGVYVYWKKRSWPFFILLMAILATTLGDFSLHYSNNCFLLGICLGVINAWLKPHQLKK